ncbi:flagellar basal body L-ring protein FlgH [Gemmatimonas sp.]|jgi:flagellar L-ring protein precursor FlgH|uniref:flagellar basal body L-ring protein FlgH n=1 Tax=Gemmatimonas sp. TaxID=1962908 RepID=UPI0037C01AAA
MTPTRLLVTTSVAVALAFAARPLSAQAAGATPPTPPATAGAQAAPTTASATTVPPVAPIKPRESWTADRRNFVVGDIITILIDDYTISTAVKENTATDNRTRGLSVNARLPTSSKQVGLDARNTADQQQRGQARRENRFQNEMSVRVVAVGPNGLLQVKGTKKIDVDQALQDIAFTGWVRAQDVSTSNVIESSRVADAQLGYASPGPLGKPKQGMITKILGAFWP